MNNSNTSHPETVATHNHGSLVDNLHIPPANEGVIPSDPLDYIQQCWPEHQPVLAAIRYIRRRDGLERPLGFYDRGGRWYPSEDEGLDVGRYRPPSRRWQNTYLNPCKTVAHCAKMHNTDRTTTLRVARAIDQALEMECRQEASMLLVESVTKLTGVPPQQSAL